MSYRKRQFKLVILRQKRLLLLQKKQIYQIWIWHNFLPGIKTVMFCWKKQRLFIVLW